MNGPVVQPPARQPGQARPAVGPVGRAVSRLGVVLLAPARALALFGAGAGRGRAAGRRDRAGRCSPCTVSGTSFRQLRHGLALSGQDEQGPVRRVHRAGAAAGSLLPRALLAVRRLAALTRRLSARWCGVADRRGVRVPVARGRRPAGACLPRGWQLSYRQRMSWLLNDRGDLAGPALAGGERRRRHASCCSPRSWASAWSPSSSPAQPQPVSLGACTLVPPPRYRQHLAELLPSAGVVRGGGRAVAAARLRRPRPAGARPVRQRRARAAGRLPGADPAGDRSTPGRPSCAGSSATCTTARRPGWSRWA